MEQTLLLASASPRRRELMACTGIPFETVSAEAEELKAGEPDCLVMENARRKAAAVWNARPGHLVLGADTVVFLAGKIFGKPLNEEDARRMLRSLSGEWHTVYTGVCLILPDGRQDVRFAQTRVQFDSLDETTICRYVASGEPMDKAGAYAVQGRAGMYVRRIEGSYSNAIGLPMHLVRDMLRKAGVDC